MSLPEFPDLQALADFFNTVWSKLEPYMRMEVLNSLSQTLSQSLTQALQLANAALLDQPNNASDENTPVWFLGIKYETQDEEFKKDLKARLWFTYRTGFPFIASTYYTSDAGWGCMLRCGQMMLAETLVRRHLGRNWHKVDIHRKEAKYKEILRWFADIPTRPYSIHQIAETGEKFDKCIGQWFGPTTVCQVLRFGVVQFGISCGP
eukprot:Colp12_sorted_trinity150504_noHs@2874